MKEAMKKLMRDDTEHGKEYYLASEVDALLSKQEQGEPDYKTLAIQLQQQRTWVGLTNEEMKAVCAQTWSYDPYLIARAIEAKLKELNT
jgi:hypothetical protein